MKEEGEEEEEDELGIDVCVGGGGDVKGVGYYRVKYDYVNNWIIICIMYFYKLKIFVELILK